MTEKENTIATGKERNTADHCRISGCDSNSSKSVTPARAGGEGKQEGSSSSSSKKQGKSCKGCLYYSSTYKSNSRSPLCLGLGRSLPQVPQFIVGESEMEASKEGRSLRDFRYACVGYSVYLDQKERSTDKQEVQTELPVCVGLEEDEYDILRINSVHCWCWWIERPVQLRQLQVMHVREKEWVIAMSGSVRMYLQYICLMYCYEFLKHLKPSYIADSGRGHGVPLPRAPKPTHPAGDEFLTRFARNANLVAMGVAKNLQKVGNRVKEGIDDIFYRRPK